MRATPPGAGVFLCLSAAARCVLPYRDGLGNGVDVVVLVFGPVVHRACEGVQTAVVIEGLRGQLRFPAAVAHHAGLTEGVRFHLCVVGQQVVVELWTLKLALEGPGCAGVRLGDVAVIAGWRGSTRSFWGCCISTIDWDFVREAPWWQVTTWCRFIPAGRPECCQIRFRIGRAQWFRY